MVNSQATMLVADWGIGELSYLVVRVPVSQVSLQQMHFS